MTSVVPLIGGRSVVESAMSDLGPFTEPSHFILVWLSECPKHGHAITTDVEAMTGKPMGPGSLHGGLARLGHAV